MENFLANLDQYVLWAFAILGACTATAKALEPVVKLTKTDKDDLVLSKINLVLSKLTELLTAVGSLNKPKP